MSSSAHTAAARGGRRRALLASLALVPLAVTAGCTATASTDEEEFPLGSAVVLNTIGGAPVLATAPQTSIGFELDFFSEEGIDASSQSLGSGSSDSSVLSMIAANADTLMTAPVSPTALMVAQESGLDVVGVYVYMREGLNSFFVLDDSPVQTLRDLEGTTVGTYAPSPGGPYAEATTIMEGNGADPDSIDIVNIGYSPATVEQLESGNVSAYIVTEPDYFTTLGTTLRVLPDETFEERFGFTYVVSGTQLEQNTDAVAALMRGIAKSTHFALTNRESAVKAHWAAYPASKNSELNDDEAMEQALLAISSRFDKYEVEDGQSYGLLANSDARWELMQQQALAAGLISEALPVAGLFDGSLIEQINDFDHEAVADAADGY